MNDSLTKFLYFLLFILIFLSVISVIFLFSELKEIKKDSSVKKLPAVNQAKVSINIINDHFNDSNASFGVNDSFSNNLSLEVR